MEKKELKNYLEILEVINWISSKSYSNIKLISNIYKELEGYPPEIIILTHWVTYINDRMKKVKDDDEKIWKKWVHFFSSIVLFYSNEMKNLNDLEHKNYTLNDYYNNFHNFKNNIENFVNKMDSSEKITQIFPLDWINIIYTLWILGSFFNKNFCKFLDKIYGIASVYEDKFDITKLNYIAYILDLLSYSIAHKKRKYERESKLKKDIFIFLTKFFEQLSQFKKFEKFDDLIGYSKYWNYWNNHRKFYSKRIMACLRDLIGLKYFKLKFDLLEKVSHPNIFKNNKNNWNKLNLTDLELPGDRWNEKFPLLNYIMVKEIKFKNSDNVSKKARKIYDFLKDLAIKNKIISDPSEFKYQPIDLDFSFWYIDEKCDKKECDKCPFGLRGFTCNPKEGKCNFITYINCINVEECPIFNKKAINTCKYIN